MYRFLDVRILTWQQVVRIIFINLLIVCTFAKLAYPPLGAMNDMNIEKNTTVFSQRFPEECEKHFNLLAKKRFKSGGGGALETSAVAPAAAAEEGEEGKKARQKKSVLARRLEEKMSANAAGKSEEELLQEVVAELKAKEHKGGGATLGLTSHASFYFIFVIIFMRLKILA
jgi:hypothetical protein